MLKKIWLLSGLVFTLSCQSQDFDLLITGGQVVDGTGSSGFHADVGIVGDRIEAIGDLSGSTAGKTIDAEGLVVSPGFIDLHTHCDRGLSEPESKANLNYLIQGTTTVVTGNCGNGALEIADLKAKWEGQGIGTNAVHLAGMGTVREAVLGREPRKPTPEELKEMRESVRQAMREGAWGMSTGLEYIPNRYADTDEVIALAEVVSEFGGVYATHQRNESTQVSQSVAETIRIAEETGVRANVSHMKACGKSNWGSIEEGVRLIEEARSRGVDITADMYPYNRTSVSPLIAIERNAGWSCFRLPDDMEPFVELRTQLKGDPENQALRQRYISALAEALGDPSKRESIQNAVESGTPDDVQEARLVEQALDADIDDICHAQLDYPVPDDLIDRMVEQDVYLVPTLEMCFTAPQFGRVAQDNVRRINLKGMKIGLGNDYSATYSIPMEIGMPLNEMFCCREPD